MADNRSAFLNLVGVSEGSVQIQNSDNGYRALVGGGTFQSYDDHPRQRIFLPKLGIYSTAAGKFQLLERYFDAYKALLKLTDFSPASQDAIATQQIKESNALSDIDSGDITSAIQKCAHIWASFPNAGYSQHENTMDYLLNIYASEISQQSNWPNDNPSS